MKPNSTVALQSRSVHFMFLVFLIEIQEVYCIFMRRKIYRNFTTTTTWYVIYINRSSQCNDYPQYPRGIKINGSVGAGGGRVGMRDRVKCYFAHDCSDIYSGYSFEHFSDSALMDNQILCWQHKYSQSVLYRHSI